MHKWESECRRLTTSAFRQLTRSRVRPASSGLSIGSPYWPGLIRVRFPVAIQTCRASGSIPVTRLRPEVSMQHSPLAVLKRMLPIFTWHVCGCQSFTYSRFTLKHALLVPLTPLFAEEEGFP